MRPLTAVLVLVGLALTACTQVDQTAVENKALALRYADEVWNQGNLDLIDEMVAENYVGHHPPSWSPKTVSGPEQLKTYIEEVRTTYPDFNVEIKHAVAETDLVASHWVVTGTHKDTNVQVSVDGLSLVRFTAGKLAEEWVRWDTHHLMEQLGQVQTTQK